MNFSNKLKLCAPKPARTQSPRTLAARALGQVYQRTNEIRRGDKSITTDCRTSTNLYLLQTGDGDINDNEFVKRRNKRRTDFYASDSDLGYWTSDAFNVLQNNNS